MNTEKIVKDVRTLINEMRLAEKDAKADYRLEQANIINVYAAELFELKE